MASRPPPVTLLAGRYRLGQRLGAGGMAEVYLAHDELRGQDVALKLLPRSLTTDPAALRRFARESEAVAALSHPNVVGAFDRGVDADGTPFLVMEYVPGQTLKEVVRADGPLPEVRALELAAEVAEGLAAAHRHGIVHRDVKPHNILVDESGRARLTDFGIARLMDATATHTEHVLGTALYVSPEQINGRVADARSDIYSLGVVVYELLTGTPPFRGESLEAVAMQHVRSAPRPPRKMRPELSQVAEAIVLRALDKDPRRRFRSAEEMAAALRAANQAGDATERMPGGWRAATTAPIMRRLAAAPVGRRLNPLIAVIPLALMTGAIALAAYGLPGAALPTVPALAGKPIEEARTAAAEGTFTLEVTERPTLDTPRGVVVAQDPPNGSASGRGATIRAVVSSGVEVPGVAGQPCAKSHAELAQRGWSIRPVRWRVANVEDFGTIVAQDPTAGSVVAQKGEITVHVAGPVAPCPVAQTATRGRSDDSRRQDDDDDD